MCLNRKRQAKKCLETWQNMRMDIIRYMRKVSSTHLLSIELFNCIRWLYLHTTKAQFILWVRACWFEPVLSTYTRMHDFRWRGSNIGDRTLQQLTRRKVYPQYSQYLSSWRNKLAIHTGVSTGSLREHAYLNILKFLPPKNENFQMKNSDNFNISAQNIDCGYSLEPPRRGGSNEYP